MGRLTLVEAEIWSVAHTDQGYAVLVKPINIEAAVPIFIGQMEAQSILIGLGDIPMPRPNTHDLFISGMAKLGSIIKKVEITELSDGIYNSTIYIEGINGEIVLDSRPSDSIAIAVRASCPLYISESVIDEAGVSLSLIKEKTVKLNDEYNNKRLSLENALDKAVKQEDYEKAARIRDELKTLDENFF